MTKMWKMLDFDQTKLIAEIKKRPGLWSLEHPADRDEKLALWKQVGAAMFKDWKECSKATAYDRVLYIQKKWRSFRDGYRREVRNRNSGVRTNKTVYRYYQAMSFLGGLTDEGQKKKRPTRRQTEEQQCDEYVIEHEVSIPENIEDTDYHDHVDQPEEDDEGSMEVETLEQDEEHLESFDTDPDPDPLVQEISTPKVTKVVKRTKTKSSNKYQRADSSEDNDEVKEVEVPLYSLDMREQEHHDVEDPDKLFLMSFLPEMKQLPVNIKMWVRAQIANIMQEAVTCHYNNSSPQVVGVRSLKYDSSQ